MSATAAAQAAPLPSRSTWARNAHSTIGVEKMSSWPNRALFFAEGLLDRLGGQHLGERQARLWRNGSAIMKSRS